MDINWTSNILERNINSKSATNSRNLSLSHVAKAVSLPGEIRIHEVDSGRGGYNDVNPSLRFLSTLSQTANSYPEASQKKKKKRRLNQPSRSAVFASTAPRPPHPEERIDHLLSGVWDRKGDFADGGQQIIFDDKGSQLSLEAILVEYSQIGSEELGMLRYLNTPGPWTSLDCGCKRPSQA